MSTSLLQDAQNKKAELLVILGQGLNSWYRAGRIKDPTVSAICNEIIKLDALICSLNGFADEMNNETGECPQCRQPLEAEAKSCEKCGFDLQEILPIAAGSKRCGTCGGTIAADSNWCPICGARAAEPPMAGGDS